MKRLLFVISSAALLILPAIGCAHGIVKDSHAPTEKISPTDYIQLGALALISIGLILYSLNQWRKDRNNKLEK